MTAVPSPPTEARGRSGERLALVRDNVLALARLALPMIVSRAGLAALGIADAIMVSRYDPAQFALLSLADGTLGRVSDVFAAFVLGGLILVPRAFGAGDLRACVRIWGRAMLPALGLGALAAALGLAGTPIFHVLGQSDALAGGAGVVAAILGVGKIAALPALGAAVFLEGTRRPAIVAASVVGANVLNVALNAMLIGGFGAIPALGARGSALSTTIVSFVLAGVLVGYAWKAVAVPARRTVARTSVPEHVQHRLGLSSAIVGGIMLSLTASLTVFAGWLGPLALAVLAAAFALNAPVMLLALGIGDATGIRVAEADGADAASVPSGGNSIRPIVFASLLAVLGVSLAFVGLWSGFPRPLATVFTHDPAMRGALATVIPLASVLLVLDGICFVAVSALRALRDIVWPTAIEIATMAALVPLAAYLAFDLAEGVRGLLVATLATAALRAVLLVQRLLLVTNARTRARRAARA